MGASIEMVGDVAVSWSRAADPGRRPPLLLVHGGCHAGWAWERLQPFLAELGWDSVALNWYGRGGSAPLADPSAALQRGIPDVAREIGVVAGSLPAPPVVVGHSMGGLAALCYASEKPVAALVLLTPVAPALPGLEPLDVPVDLAQWWLPPDEETARFLFFDAVGDEEAGHYASALVPESPLAVWQATRWTVPVPSPPYGGATLVVSASDDPLVPPPVSQTLVDHLRADHVALTGQGHGVTLNPICQQVGTVMADWLGPRFDGSG